MSPVQAVSTVLRKYAVFSGRARRSEYWWFQLFNLVVGILAAVLDGLIFGWGEDALQLVSIVVTLALFLPSLGVAIRRLHDTDRRGWWILIGLIPLVGSIILLVFYVQDSREPNRYGPSPKGALVG